MCVYVVYDLIQFVLNYINNIILIHSIKSFCAFFKYTCFFQYIPQTPPPPPSSSSSLFLRLDLFFRKVNFRFMIVLKTHSYTYAINHKKPSYMTVMCNLIYIVQYTNLSIKAPVPERNPYSTPHSRYAHLPTWIPPQLLILRFTP